MTEFITVWPANEAMRKALRHPRAGAFRDTLDQGIDWPADSFTHRRLQDGDVLDHPPTRSEVRQSEAERPVPAAGISREQMGEMTKAQLLEEAVRVGAEVSPSSSKADIIAAIEQRS
jgi:hypothetical protein